jgi:hypothetical protein
MDSLQFPDTEFHAAAQYDEAAFGNINSPHYNGVDNKGVRETRAGTQCALAPSKGSISSARLPTERGSEK